MRRQQIDPTKIRKHSRIVEKLQDPVAVAGPREQTDFGYTVDKYKGKSFETKFVCLAAGATTPKWLHEKKTRVLHVMGGLGTYETFDSDGNSTIQAINVGDEVVIEPGVTHRIRSSPTKLEFFVTQEPKYEAALKEVEPVETVAQVSEAELQPVSQEDKTHQTSVVLGVDRTIRRNKAREQLAALRGNHNSGPREKSGSNESDFFRTSAGGAGLNVMPVMSFDPDGAG